MKPMSPAPNGSHRRGVKFVAKMFSSATGLMEGAQRLELWPTGGWQRKARMACATNLSVSAYLRPPR